MMPTFLKYPQLLDAIFTLRKYPIMTSQSEENWKELREIIDFKIRSYGHFDIDTLHYNLY